jgi:hypothetical protein
MTRKDTTGRPHERGHQDALIVPRSARVIVAIAGRKEALIRVASSGPVDCR